MMWLAIQDSVLVGLSAQDSVETVAFDHPHCSLRRVLVMWLTCLLLAAPEGEQVLFLFLLFVHSRAGFVWKVRSWGEWSSFGGLSGFCQVSHMAV